HALADHPIEDPHGLFVTHCPLINDSHPTTRSSIRRLRRLYEGGARSHHSSLPASGAARSPRAAGGIPHPRSSRTGVSVAFQRKSPGATKRRRMSGALKTENRSARRPWSTGLGDI